MKTMRGRPRSTGFNWRIREERLAYHRQYNRDHSQSRGLKASAFDPGRDPRAPAMTVREIGAVLGISHQRVQQLLDSALDKMRAAVKQELGRPVVSDRRESNP